MAIPDGKPATDFSAMNREWVRAVAEEAGESALPSVSGSDNGKVLTVVTGEWKAATPAASGIPAPANPSDGDVLTYDSDTSAWVAAAPSGGGGGTYVINLNKTTHVLDKTFLEIYMAYISGYVCIVKKVDEATAEYGEEDTFSYIVTCIRDYDLQGDGEGGTLIAGNGDSFSASTDTDYPLINQ